MISAKKGKVKIRGTREELMAEAVVIITSIAKGLGTGEMTPEDIVTLITQATVKDLAGDFD